MSRLTKRNSKGIAYMAIADTLPKEEQEIEGSKPILEGLYGMFQKLADFEDAEEKDGSIMIPIKPLNRTGYPEGNRDTCDGQCPNCMSNVRNITPRSKKVNYCQDCGQAIDWNI